MNNNQSLGQVLGVRVYSVIWGNHRIHRIPSRFDFHIMLKFQAHAHSETASAVLKRDTKLTQFIQFTDFDDLLHVQATWSDECQLPLTYLVATLSM